MPTTKIINILRDDKFENILDIFQKVPAQEVIFVMPKNTNVLSEESHFAILAKKSEETGKKVLILTSNPEISDLAMEYDFGVLASKESNAVKIRKAKKLEVLSQAEISSDNEVSPDESDVEVQQEPEARLEAQFGDDDQDAPNTEEPEKVEERPVYHQQDQGYLPDIELAVAKRESSNMSDIMVSDEKEIVKVNVPRKVERPLNVQIKKSDKMGPDDIESVWQSRKDSPRIARPPAPNLQLPGFSMGSLLFKLSKKTLYLYGIAVVIIFGLVLYLATGSAKIIIKPRAHSLDFSLKIFSSDKYSSVSNELKQVPGQLFSVDKNIEETFPATGERDVAQKAKGKLTVYNNYGTTPQTLIATTRFESASGLIFRTLKTVTIPGTTVRNGEISPGKIEVEVIADKAGDSYNIGAGKFTLPAFKEKGDSDRYQKFYGISEESMRGGIIGKAKVVTDADYINAKAIVAKKVVSEAENELRQQATGLEILSLSAPSVKEPTSTAQPDEASDMFTISQTAVLKTVGFKKSDLFLLIANYVSDINNLTILPEKLDLEFKNVEFNEETQILEFTVAIKGPAYSVLDKDKIILDLIGKNEQNIKDYIKNVEGIASARVILSPFWVRKVPARLERIKFELEY